MKKIISCLLSLVMVFSLSIPAFASENDSSTPDDTITITQKIYFDEIVPVPSANDQDTLSQYVPSRTGSRPKKWVVYDVRVTDDEWTDFSKKLGVFKSQNGSTITGTVSTSVNSSYTATVSVPVYTITAAVGYSVSTGFAVTGSSTAKIPDGYKLAAARAYPIYEVTAFKAKLVHAIGSTVYKRGEGTSYKPIGAEVVFDFKRA